MDEEPDYEALWQRIVASAEQEIERQKRQAGWLEEAGLSYNADLLYAAQRRFGKAFIRRAWQQYDLAAAICSGDIAGYIDRWHPQPTPNGSRIEWKVTCHSDEIELIPGYVYEESEDDDATLWRAVGGGTAGYECQTSTYLQDRLPAEHTRTLHAQLRSFLRRAYAWSVRHHFHRWSDR